MFIRFARQMQMVSKRMVLSLDGLTAPFYSLQSQRVRNKIVCLYSCVQSDVSSGFLLAGGNGGMDFHFSHMFISLLQWSAMVSN
jgi:hypothetical protein